MAFEEFNSIISNWSGQCGRPSVIIGLLQISVLFFVVFLSFKSAKLTIKRYLSVTTIVSLVPIVAGIIFYWLGSMKALEALQNADPSIVDSLKKASELESLSCLLGSISYVIWIFLIFFCDVLNTSVQKSIV